VLYYYFRSIVVVIFYIKRRRAPNEWGGAVFFFPTGLVVTRAGIIPLTYQTRRFLGLYKNQPIPRSWYRFVFWTVVDLAFYNIIHRVRVSNYMVEIFQVQQWKCGVTNTCKQFLCQLFVLNNNNIIQFFYKPTCHGFFFHLMNPGIVYRTFFAIVRVAAAAAKTHTHSVIRKLNYT